MWKPVKQCMINNMQRPWNLKDRVRNKIWKQQRPVWYGILLPCLYDYFRHQIADEPEGFDLRDFGLRDVWIHADTCENNIMPNQSYESPKKRPLTLEWCSLASSEHWSKAIVKTQMFPNCQYSLISSSPKRLCRRQPSTASRLVLRGMSPSSLLRANARHKLLLPRSLYY